MRNRRVRTLLLLLVLAVAPASAHRMIAASTQHGSGSCVYERASAGMRVSAGTAAGETVVTLTHPLRPGPVFRGASFLRP